MLSQPEELRARTKDFAKRIVGLFRALPKSDEARVPGKAGAALGHCRRGELPGRLPSAVEGGVHRKKLELLLRKPTKRYSGLSSSRR